MKSNHEPKKEPRAENETRNLNWEYQARSMDKSIRY